jgi:hypothetical protein
MRPKEGERGREIERDRERGREREGESVCLCVCVGVSGWEGVPKEQSMIEKKKYKKKN